MSEISLFFVARAQHLQLIRRHQYLVAVATTIILMVASPLVIKALQTLHGSGGVGGGGGSGGGSGNGDCLPSGLIGGGRGGAGGTGEGRAGNVEMGWRSPAKKKDRDTLTGAKGSGDIGGMVVAAAASAMTAAAGGGGAGGGGLSRASAGLGERGTGARRRVMLV